MGLLGRTAPPHEERIFPAPQSGARAPLTLRIDWECLIICLNVWMSRIFATAIQPRSYFHIPTASFPAPHQSVVYIPEPFYFHSQHSASQRHPERAPPRVRKSPTQAVPLGRRRDGHWTEPTGGGRGGELHASAQPCAQDGAWQSGNDGLQAQSWDAGSEISLPPWYPNATDYPSPSVPGSSSAPSLVLTTTLWGRVTKSGLHRMTLRLREAERFVQRCTDGQCQNWGSEPHLSGSKLIISHTHTHTPSL